jgi:hypothetical protein
LASGYLQVSACSEAICSRRSRSTRQRSGSRVFTWRVTKSYSPPVTAWIKTSTCSAGKSRSASRPDARGIVPTPGEDATLVATELRAVNVALVLESRTDLLSRAGIPQPRGIQTPGEDATLVATELRVVNVALVLENRADLLSRAGIPQPRGMVLTPGEDATLVTTELRVEPAIATIALRRAKPPVETRFLQSSIMVCSPVGPSSGASDVARFPPAPQKAPTKAGIPRCAMNLLCFRRFENGLSEELGSALREAATTCRCPSFQERPQLAGVPAAQANGRYRHHGQRRARSPRAGKPLA